MKPYPLILLLLLTFVARSQLKLTITSINKSACGMNNGSVMAVASNGVPPYEYLTGGRPGYINGNFTSLRPGEYVIAAKDATGTVVESEHFFITDSTIPPVPTFNIKHPSFCDKLDGVLTIVMPAGPSPYQYSLDNLTYQTSNVFTNLSNGGYLVYVKDVNGCRNTLPISVFLFGPGCGTIRVSGTLPTCGNNGQFSVVDPLPGISPRKYSLDGINYQDSPTFTNLAPGVYFIRIRDSTGFVRLFSVALTYNCVMQLSLATVAAGCGNNDGSITASPIQGEGPYEYSVNDRPYQTSNRFDFLQAGTYLVKVRDARGLIVSMDATLASSCPATTTIITKDATCGQPNGEIEVTGSGGRPPYMYSIDGTNYQVSNRFAGLAAAGYTVFLKDAAGAINSTNALISGQPLPRISAMATAASCLDNDGRIAAVTAGNLAPLLYSINQAGFNSSPVFENLASGNYKLMVKDGNGCTASADVIVPLENSLLLSLDSQVTICEGSTASLKVNSNASLFQWSPGQGISDPATRDQDLRPVTTTRYNLIATTGKCTRSASVLVIVNPQPMADAGKDQVICYGQDARLEGRGGLKFNWSPSTYLTDRTNPNPVAIRPASTLAYALTVTDAAGCSSLQAATVTITVTTPRVFAGNDTSVLANQPFNLNALDINNSGFTEYNWQPTTGLSNPLVAEPLATLEKTTTYRVTARTASGCEASDEVIVKTYKTAEIYVPNAFTPNGDGHNDYARPVLIGISELTNFTIYNRWGGIVYRFTPGSNGWDGRLKGILQSSALFTWVAEGSAFGGTKIKKYGTITLIR